MRPVYFEFAVAKLHVGVFILSAFTFDAKVCKGRLLGMCFFQINNFLRSLCSEAEKTWLKSNKRLFRHATEVRTLQSIYMFELVSHERSRFCSHMLLLALHVELFHQSRECVKCQNTHS